MNNLLLQVHIITMCDRYSEFEWLKDQKKMDLHVQQTKNRLITNKNEHELPFLIYH